MSAVHAIILGIVQGLTEFLPISSSAHLRIVPAFLGWEDPGAAFTAVIQIGTLLAVLIYFRADILRIVSAWLRSLTNKDLRSNHDARLGWFIGLGTLPVVVFGFAFKDQIETGARNLYLIGTTLIVLGLVLLLAEKVATRSRGIETIERTDGVMIGLAQALALVPGVSRSGATITAGLLRGLTREAAARYSFLLSIPAVLLSGLFELRHVGDAAKVGEESASMSMTILAAVLAFVVGYASIAFLLRFLAQRSTAVFVGYRIAIGAAVLIAAGAGSIH